MFESARAGRCSPRVDPKPILDGWKLLGHAIYRAAGKNPVLRPTPITQRRAGPAMRKEALQLRVL